MKKMAFLAICIVLFASCQQNGNPGNTEKDTTIVISNDTIPETRTFVSPKPVASFSESVNDELNDWKFAVSVCETQRTFHYILRIQYKELRVTDSINIPNFGIEPQPDLRKGPEPLSCIVGFLDKKGQFKEYRKVAIHNEKLRITSLASYYVGSYKTKQTP